MFNYNFKNINDMKEKIEKDSQNIFSGLDFNDIYYINNIETKDQYNMCTDLHSNKTKELTKLFYDSHKDSMILSLATRWDNIIILPDYVKLLSVEDKLTYTLPDDILINYDEFDPIYEFNYDSIKHIDLTLQLKIYNIFYNSKNGFYLKDK